MAVSWLSPNSRLRGKFPHVGFHGCFIAAGDRAQLITLSPLKRPVRLGKHASVWGSQEEQQSAHHSLYLGTFRLTPWTNEEEKASGWWVQLMYWCPSSTLQLLQYFFGWYFGGWGESIHLSLVLEKVLWSGHLWHYPRNDHVGINVFTVFQWWTYLYIIPHLIV